MRYILIQNEGEIETNSFELIGASTKRGQEGKIGFFGSGLKYSIAYMMRKGIGFKVFSGENELVFSTTPENLKDQRFDRITINGKPTSYTVTMGPTWTQDWFILREIYCNALDEGSCTLVKETENVSPSPGKTRIYIELTESLKEVIDNWDNYFSDERTPLFTAEKIYTSGLGNEDGSTKNQNYQEVSIFHKTSGTIYRRGIKVHQDKGYIFDYGVEFVNINEDRTAKNISGLSYMIADMMGQFVNEDWVKSILREDKSTEFVEVAFTTVDQRHSEKWVQFSKENLLVVKEIAGKYADKIAASAKECFLIPKDFAKSLKKSRPTVVILGMASAIGETFLSEIEMTPKMSYLLKEVSTALVQMGYEIPFPVMACEFTDDNIMGQADVPNKKIFIANKTFDMGRRELAMTLIEETEHIISGKGDETRGFQTHLMSRWLTTMENANGLFL